jgi:signal transduction histidine kinase
MAPSLPVAPHGRSDRNTGRPVRSAGPILALALGALVLLIVVAGYATRQKVDEIYLRMAVLNGEYREGERSLQEVRGGIRVSSVLLRDFLLDPSTDHADRYRSELRELRASASNELARLETFFAASPLPQLLELRREVDNYWESFAPVFTWTLEEKRARSSTFLRRQVMPKRDAALSLADQIGQFHDEAVRRQERGLAASEHELKRFVLQTMVASASLGVVIAIMTIGRLSHLERRAGVHRKASEKAEAELRRLSHQLVHLQEEERRVLSRELHDEVGQILTGLRMEMSRLGGCADRSTPEFDARLARLTRTLETTVQSVRDLAMGLRPSMLDDIGLAPAVRWQAREFSRRSDIPVTVTMHVEEGSLPDDYRTTIYRIVQEALTNCARHARASSVRILLQPCGDRLVLEVHDDGRGVQGVQRPEESGLGLLGMSERARELGGSLDVCSGEATGTTVTVTLPMPSGQSHA